MFVSMDATKSPNLEGTVVLIVELVLTAVESMPVMDKALLTLVMSSFDEYSLVIKQTWKLQSSIAWHWI